MTTDKIHKTSVKIFGATPQTRWCFLTVHTSQGHSGTGEATLQRHEEALLLRAEQYLPKLIGLSAEPAAVEMANGQDLVGSAITSALSQALWDIKAKVAGQSVGGLLGSEYSQSVKVYANINRRTTDRSADSFARSARSAFDQGHRAFKIAPFDEVLRGTGKPQHAALLQNGIERIATVREMIGPDCDLMVDCHWRLDPELTATVIEQCRSYKLFWLECPLAETQNNLTEIAALRKKANAEGTLLAGCELCVGVEGFRPFLEANAYDVFMPDIKYIGCIEDMCRLWELLSGTDVRLSPHNPSGPVSHAATLHVCNALSPDIRMEMQFDETPLFWSLAPNLPQPVNGRSALPTGAGLGCEVSAEVLNRHIVYDKEYA